MSDHDGLGPEGSYFEHKARREEEARRARGDAMFPVWITVLYLVLGFVFGLWHPGWLVFLTVPIHYMHFDSQWERLTNPVTVTLIYLVLGFFFGLWHPGWLVFWPSRWARCTNPDKAARGRVPDSRNAAAPLFLLCVGEGPVPRGRGRDGGREGLALP